MVRIRYSLEDDWTGDPLVFFRVVLSDEASREEQLGKTGRSIIDGIRNEIRPDKLGFKSFRFFG